MMLILFSFNFLQDFVKVRECLNAGDDRLIVGIHQFELLRWLSGSSRRPFSCPSRICAQKTRRFSPVISTARGPKTSTSVS